MATVVDSRVGVEALIQTATDRWLAFVNPVRIVSAEAPADVNVALREVERLTRDVGLHAVGFVTYAAGIAFGLSARVDRQLPLVWFGLFDRSSVTPVERPVATAPYELGPINPTLDAEAFGQAFDRVKRHIADGETYQANFTFKMTASFEGDGRSMFADLVDGQQGRYSAYLSIGDHAICSASPELFFELDGAGIRTRPMKGTTRRGLTAPDDRLRRDALRDSAKEQAENVMIVDMMRNDLGRIAEVGSVRVPSLFEVERYPTVWQMTSAVTARSLAPLDEVFAALHPSASVTGAPKVRTMEILRELEPEPRGIYTGAIGHVPPDGNAVFNVAIRTAVVDRVRRSVEFGVGSGIVWDSSAAAEYQECLLKGAVLGRRTPRFELLETMRWTPPEGFFLLDRHLDRMAASAEYFGFAWDLTEVRAALAAAVGEKEEGLRVRLLVGPSGVIRIEHTPLLASGGPLRVRIASAAVDAGDVWLFHKTTNRRVYEAARAGLDCDDVILWNSRGEATEATTANIVVELGGRRLTPPIASGVLGGTFREELLARGEVVEGVVLREQLLSAAPVWLVNSVHEWRRAEVML